MADGRIAKADPKFDLYINGTADHLLLTPGGSSTPANWERLLLTSAENTLWQDFKDDWNDKYGTVKTNKLNGISDINATKAKNKAKADFIDWVTKPGANKLDFIGNGPAATNNDRTVFNIKLRDETPTARTKITTSPYVDFKSEDGGVILVTCQVEKVSDRPSMHPAADVIEMKYIVMDEDATPPSTVAGCPGTYIATKAISRFEEAADQPGKRVHAFLRWRNNTEPAKSSPWSQRETVIIGD